MHLYELNVKNLHTHKNTTLVLKDGVNWLVGQNESGKSLLLNSIGYALYGQGLVGKITEYKDLKTTLSFKVGETDYVIHRGQTTYLDKIEYDDGLKKVTRLTVGKTATNVAITNILGYDYSVFVRMNYSKQLEGISLSSANTTERLKLINKINGVDEANLFEKYLEDKKKEIKSELKILQAQLSNKPSDNFQINLEYEAYAKIAYLETIAEKVKENYAARNDVQKALNIIKTIVSLQDFDKEFTNQFHELHLDSVEEIEKSLADWQVTIFNFNSTQDDLQKLKNNILKIQQDYSNILDDIRYEELKSIIENNKLYEIYQSKDRDELIICPSCSHTFYKDIEHTHSFTYIEISESDKNLFKITEDFKTKIEPVLNMYIQDEKSLTIKLDKISDEIKLIPEEYRKQDLKNLRQELADHKKYLLNKSQLANNISELNQLLDEDYKDTEDFQNLQLAYDQLYDKLCQEGDELSHLSNTLTSYFAEKRIYETLETQYKKQIEQINTLSNELEVYTNILEESKRLKLEIQNTCIPLLNNAASKLINKLTGGKRFSLTLNETFELTLDGKSIDTYSGSTIVLANVAFRVAMIQTFFKNTFPVFIGDEIDAYADDTRAQEIHDAFNVLQKEGYQIILVSHHALSFQGNKIDVNSIKEAV